MTYFRVTYLENNEQVTEDIDCCWNEMEQILKEFRYDLIPVISCVMILEDDGVKDIVAVII